MENIVSGETLFLFAISLTTFLFIIGVFILAYNLINPEKENYSKDT